MFVIALRQGRETTWLASTNPPRWGERDRAVRFDTRRDARRVATVLKVSGDWSIENAGPLPPTAAIAPPPNTF